MDDPDAVASPPSRPMRDEWGRAGERGANVSVPESPPLRQRKVAVGVFRRKRSHNTACASIGSNALKHYHSLRIPRVGYWFPPTVRQFIVKAASRRYFGKVCRQTVLPDREFPDPALDTHHPRTGYSVRRNGLRKRNIQCNKQRNYDETQRPPRSLFEEVSHRLVSRISPKCAR